MKNKILHILMVLFAVIFLISAIQTGRIYMEGKHSAEAFADLTALVSDGIRTETESEGSDQSKRIPSSEAYKEVYEANTDFAGWIRIPGTRVDYPVMLTPGDWQYYLHRDFEKKKSSGGVPFMQGNCIPGKSDNLILYGHHMRNGSMFADLMAYQDPTFLEEHRIVFFDTMEEYGLYEICSVLKTTASEGGFRFDLFTEFDTEEKFEEFVENCRKNALYDTGISMVYGERLLTLSTCEYSRKNGRMVLVAKRIEN